MTIYNLDQAIKIVVKGSYRDRNLEYRKECNIPFFKQPERWSFCFALSEVYTRGQLEAGAYNGTEYVFIDGQPNFKPTVRYYFNNDHTLIEWFETFEEAKARAEECIKTTKYPKLIIEN